MRVMLSFTQSGVCSRAICCCLFFWESADGLHHFDDFFRWKDNGVALYLHGFYDVVEQLLSLEGIALGFQRGGVGGKVFLLVELFGVDES